MKSVGLSLIVAGLILGGFVIWAFAGQSETSDFAVLGGIVTVAMIALGLLVLTEPDRRR